MILAARFCNLDTRIILDFEADPHVIEEVQVGKDQEKAQSEKDSHSKNPNEQQFSQ